MMRSLNATVVVQLHDSDGEALWSGQFAVGGGEWRAVGRASTRASAAGPCAVEELGGEEGGKVRGELAR